MIRLRHSRLLSAPVGIDRLCSREMGMAISHLRSAARLPPSRYLTNVNIFLRDYRAASRLNRLAVDSSATGDQHMPTPRPREFRAASIHSRAR